MKPFDEQTDPSAPHCALRVMEVVPLVMQALREEVRSQRKADFSVPQFRALSYVARHRGTSLSDVAEHIGLSLPSLSKLMDGLVTRNLVRRRVSSQDRRRVTLTLTAHGRRILQGAHDTTQTSLSARLDVLDERDLEAVCRAMDVLEPLFNLTAKG